MDALEATDVDWIFGWEMLRKRERERDLVKSFINDPIQVDHPMSRNGIQILGRIKDSPLNPVTQAGL